MKLFATAVGIISLFSTLQANAVIIGDKDWRQVTETTGFSWNDFDDVYDTTTGMYDGAGALLGGTGGVSVEGWTWADNSEVNDLLVTLLSTGFPSTSPNTAVILGAGGADPFFAIFDHFDASENRDILTGWTRKPR